MVTFQVAPCDKGLFIYDQESGLKLIELTEGKIIKDYGMIQDSGGNLPQRMLVTRDGKYLFTGHQDGKLQQYSVRARTLVQESSWTGLCICSICD